MPLCCRYSTVINAFAQTGTSKAAEKAEALCLSLQDLRTQEGWEDLKPNAILLSTVINGWAKARNPTRAELLLHRMYEEYALEGNQDVKPTRQTFNSVLLGWSKSSAPDANESAAALLQKMRELANAGILETTPDVVSYNCVMTAFARRSSGPEAVAKAEALLQEMIERAAAGDLAAMPNEITFTTLIKAISVSRTSAQDKIERMKAVLDLMKRNGVPANVFIMDQIRKLELSQHVPRI
jgi:pentatricopeptide repeat protein